LLSTWNTLQIPLKIVGDGPLRESVRNCAEKSPFIEYLGQVSQKAVMDLMRQARFLVFTSNLYEGLPMTIIESFACGKPVVASHLDARVELIQDSETGLLYIPGDSASLAAKATWLWNHPDVCAEMGHNARLEYEKKYTPERNYQMLGDIYLRAIDQKR
jgi:glycosyltransferase involved in cell wall biosynthesis